MTPEGLKDLARSVPVGSVPWFDLLERTGRLAALLASDTIATREYAIWICSPPQLMKERGDKIAALIEPLIRARGGNVPEIKRLFRFADFGTSAGMCRLFVDLISLGAFDDDNGPHWHSHLHGFAKVNPTAAAKVVATALDRSLVLGRVKGVESPFDGREGLYGIDIPQELVIDSARLDPGAYAEEMLPRIASLLAANEKLAKDGDILDTIWLFRTFGFAESFKDQVLSSAATALALLAERDTARMDRIVAPFDQMPHQNMGYLLLTGWAGNPAFYADRIADYLLANTQRLDIGYAIWDSGNGISAVTREALTAAGPHLSEERLRRLEATICEYYPDSERSDLKGRGFHQYLLLCALPQERLSQPTVIRLQEWERKFPEIEKGGPIISNSDGIVRSPIPRPSAEKMSDDQWLNAMLTHDSEEGTRRRIREDFFTGGAHQLSGILEQLARANKPRFARLALRMDARFVPAYFEALLRGLSAKVEPKAKGQLEEPASFLTDEEFEKFLLHVYGVKGDEIGRWFCSALAARADHALNPTLMEILARYAVNANDPETDSWLKGDTKVELYGGDPLTEGINTARGEAAHAIALLLFANRTRINYFRSSIESLVNDKSVSVRSVAIECLLAMLNFDRDSAVPLFLTAVACEDSILRTHTVRHFVHYVVFSHYDMMRDFLLRMLASSVSEVRKRAAQNIALAAYSLPQAQSDLQMVAEGDEYCRSGIASIDASNFEVDECREIARVRLKAFFNDPSKVVRSSASKVLRKMGSKLLVSENELLAAFIDSDSFTEHVSTLIYVLKEAGEQLPEVVCRIGERAAELHRTGGTEAQWWTHDVGELVLRLYDQTEDPALQKRCLDLIDQMVEYRFGNIDTGLREAERE